MQTPIRVLIVDDAVVVRHMASAALNAEPDIEVVGVAANGRIALERLARCHPDVIVLDLEMPELDGMQTLIELGRLGHPAKVLLFSALTDREAHRGIEALALGASDVLPKPGPVRTEGWGLELAERIRTLMGRGVAATERGPTPAAPPSPTSERRRPAHEALDLIVLGTSTGGPNALATVFEALPGDLPVPVCIVQHMPPVFTKALASRLDGLSPLTVHEAQGGEMLQPGEAFVAPGGSHLLVERGTGGLLVTSLSQDPPENECRPAVDPLFRSAAAACGSRVLGAVLTGMGSDGCAGAEALQGAGARVIAQDEESSVVWGMPGHVVRAGLADSMLPLSEVGPELARLARLRAKKEAG